MGVYTLKLNVDGTILRKQLKKLVNVICNGEYAIDEGVMTRADLNALEGIRNLIDKACDEIKLKDKLNKDGQDPKAFNLVKCNIKQPDSSGWYFTSKGQLFWWKSKNNWSCRNDIMSEEYPDYWLKEVL